MRMLTLLVLGVEVLGDALDALYPDVCRQVAVDRLYRSGLVDCNKKFFNWNLNRTGTFLFRDIFPSWIWNLAPCKFLSFGRKIVRKLPVLYLALDLSQIVRWMTISCLSFSALSHATFAFLAKPSLWCDFLSLLFNRSCCDSTKISLSLNTVRVLALT